ncbi:MAG: hypothetical protein P8J86_04080 [Phycisphaerales bacterium]|nr:hypothetical protein [Phycisphaerales bacterium]
MRLVWTILAWAITIFGVIVFIAWLVGEICSNRWHWSQWLLWIPSPLVIVILLVSLLGGIKCWYPMQIQWQRMAPLVLALLFVTAFFTLWEHRFFRQAQNPRDGLSILCWTMASRTISEKGEEVFFHEVNPDIAILTWGDDLARSKTLFKNHLPNHQLYRGDGVVTVLSKFPVQEIRPVIWNSGLYMSLVVIDASPFFSEPLVVYVVDLPSSTKIGRMQIANDLKKILDKLELPPPDLVVGDFNMNRGSSAIRKMFPDMRNAYNVAGSGYAASFPREWPIYHIDLALLGPRITATGYELIDSGMARHWAQLLHIKPISAPQ